ncbi:DeoR/GlpR family DNA-binding transcription regulator [Niameybacter massiliensis]|uniref:Lactose phosphotransferase system repressor n=1 Tax=Holtiella tumoricola TaxID=3018743 RepID=A0AA42J1H8_9FIRM|nr:DeoR/GlpR family DNA-binding transcription regulator [Holtiella tumoricola]MDA3732514.1 DeoR/GlpR family DNA-binding transcription regulator [Holtiella tumoricola]
MQRSEKILDLLAIHRTMSIHQLKEELFCSTSSLRRDLIDLEATGSIRRIRGGATLVSGTNFDYSSQFRNNLQVKEKEHISDIARDFVTNGMSLFLDSSSTVIKLCPYLDQLRNITVATNGLHTSLLLGNSTHINTFITGGQLLNRSATLLGEEATDWIAHMKADLAFISCRGVDADGIYDADIRQAKIKQAMLMNAKKTILLVDNTKIGTHFFHRICTFSQLHAIVTDQEPSETLKQAIENQGCLLLY